MQCEEGVLGEEQGMILNCPLINIKMLIFLIKEGIICFKQGSFCIYKDHSHYITEHGIVHCGGGDDGSERHWRQGGQLARKAVTLLQVRDHT